MAKSMSNFPSFNPVKHQKPPTSIIFIILTTIISSVLSELLVTDCSLDIQFSSPGNDSYSEAGNWGGFLYHKGCAVAFEGYLYALGRQANKTGRIFSNSTEQKNCLDSMKSIGEDGLSCGIERLVTGASDCSDYTVKDVDDKLGKRLRKLGEDCQSLGSEGKPDHQDCNACLRSWDEIGGSGDERADVCRFSVLVSLISKRIGEKKWVQEVCRCLRKQSTPMAMDGQEGSVEKKPNIRKGLYFVIGGLMGIAVIVLIASWILCSRRHKDDYPKGKDASDDSESEEFRCLNISIKEIYSATNNLSASNFIGQGIAGKVYRGMLSNGQHIAVKHIFDNECVETFIREVTSLSHVRHPNLVTLLGYCEKEEECFLVYELCHNGNLSEWLYGKDKVLSWILRLEIAIDCARGLWFLHTYPEGCIVHRDIKPTNILISANFHAKLSDFGLSKVMDLDQSYVSSEVRGTFGYVDPEYQINHHVNSSGDIYSFGIVLLQILSGKRVLNLNSKKPMPLDKMARFLMKGRNISEFADPKLNGEYSVEAFELILELALTCTGLKKHRPSIEQVVIILEKALDISRRVELTAPHSTPYIV
ncbi:hypothetical protein VitviT2T_000755 [Vitis vinifera]|uniref:Protein kinase domain-containing protein n=1 Tax=Vitis vinifera TaxID=29760 RepID=A0ABY9BDH0_VITVI|nr:probable serine/threonine-protein kinase PBL28 [Vitis vinifera]WJZ80883.1 hypothetical protein VitviT2T_000755 [Vitis vinifera]|eukprot:XP_010653355.1 PREDICTED: proline-rich receptor-like protein kinase PERK3 [Vitis vinifera]